MQHHSREDAIRAKCLDCSCFQPNEVRKCPVKTCALWPCRMGKRSRCIDTNEARHERPGLHEKVDKRSRSRTVQDSRSTVYAMVRQRRIPYVKVGRLVKFDVPMLDAWIRRTRSCRCRLDEARKGEAGGCHSCPRLPSFSNHIGYCRR